MLYEFKCNNCNHIFEVKQSIHENHKAVCPQCGKPAQRIFSLLQWFWDGSVYRPDGSRRQDKDYALVMEG